MAARRKPVLERVLIVGHEPYLSELVAFLLAGDAGLAMTLRKGGLCKLTVPQPIYSRGATLEWLLTPKRVTTDGYAPVWSGPAAARSPAPARGPSEGAARARSRGAHFLAA